MRSPAECIFEKILRDCVQTMKTWALKLTLLNTILLGRQLTIQRSELETATERMYVQPVDRSVRATRSIPLTAQAGPARAPNFDPTFIDTEATNSYIIHSEPAEAKQERCCTRRFSFGCLCAPCPNSANQPHTHRRSRFTRVTCLHCLCPGLTYK